MVDRTHLEELAAATRRLIRTVDAMAETAYAEPSLLPGWTRGDVVAHLALNAEGMAGALRGLTEGTSVPMYASQEVRDGDIAALGRARPEAIRNRLLGGTTDFNDAVAAVPEDVWGIDIDRVPGGRIFKAGALPGMRHREVEIHHADLGLGYSHADWPPAFAVRLIEAMAKRDSAAPMAVHATDVEHTWHLGDGGPTVRGSAAELGWWLTGRGEGAGLSCDEGALPRIEAW